MLGNLKRNSFQRFDVLINYLYKGSVAIGEGGGAVQVDKRVLVVEEILFTEENFIQDLKVCIDVRFHFHHISPYIQVYRNINIISL